MPYTHEWTYFCIPSCINRNVHVETAQLLSSAQLKVLARNLPSDPSRWRDRLAHLPIVLASARPSATRGTLFGTSSYGGHLCLKPPTVPGVDGCGWFSGEPAPGNAWKRKHQIQQHDRNDTEMPSPCSTTD